MRFEVTAKDAGTRARVGRLSLRFGTVETPAFMPVGSRGSVRGLSTPWLRECGVQMLLANAYHLALRPGVEVVARAGGLHAFMAWRRPILTDSGGYQVFSLAGHRRVSDEGVLFQSPVDGRRMFLGPSECMRIQRVLGADVAMALDECPPFPCERAQAEASVRRTLKWGRECLRAERAKGQALFGIVQGSVFDDLRESSARRTVEVGFDGYAIGGVSVGEPVEERRRVVALTASMLPADRPRYLMGVGFPLDVLDAVAQGVDLFDCVAPTRMGRNATAFTSTGRLRLRNAAFRRDPRPVEEGCGCVCCRLYSRAYVHHLFCAGEMLGPVLLSIHNVTFYARMMAHVRDAVRRGEFAEFRRRFAARYVAGEERK